MASVRVFNNENVVLMGKRKISGNESGRDRWCLYFGYKDQAVEGMGAFNFYVFDNNRSINPSELKVNSNYSISYHYDDKYLRLDRCVAK